MKIKYKNKDIDKLKITLSHKELVLLNESLKEYHVNPSTKDINNKLFDKDEYNNPRDLIDSSVYMDILALEVKTRKVLNDIDPY